MQSSEQPSKKVSRDRPQIGLAPTTGPRASGQPEPVVNLSSYRYHTGATLRPLESDEECPVLFRDIGPDAMIEFLEGRLIRLAGPLSPITYMRTADYREPYTCYERIGRLVFLQPKTLLPWHSGINTIYVADARMSGEREAIGFVPGELSLHDAAVQLQGVRTLAQLREVLGRSALDDAIHDTRVRLKRLNDAREATERFAEPVRRGLQSGSAETRLRIREELDRADVTESDLCAAWHHLPRERREALGEKLQGISLSSISLIRTESTIESRDPTSTSNGEANSGGAAT